MFLCILYLYAVASIHTHLVGLPFSAQNTNVGQNIIDIVTTRERFEWLDTALCSCFASLSIGFYAVPYSLYGNCGHCYQCSNPFLQSQITIPLILASGPFLLYKRTNNSTKYFLFKNDIH